MDPRVECGGLGKTSMADSHEWSGAALCTERRLDCTGMAVVVCQRMMSQRRE